jgi:hypothetical protein
MSPPTERTGPPQQGDRPSTKIDSHADTATVAPRPNRFVPPTRPWRDHATERRFQQDRAQWRRRIECARRLSYEGRDEVVAPGGRWSA